MLSKIHQVIILAFWTIMCIIAVVFMHDEIKYWTIIFPILYGTAFLYWNANAQTKNKYHSAFIILSYVIIISAILALWVNTLPGIVGPMIIYFSIVWTILLIASAINMYLAFKHYKIKYSKKDVEKISFLKNRWISYITILLLPASIYLASIPGKTGDEYTGLLAAYVIASIITSTVLKSMVNQAKKLIYLHQKRNTTSQTWK